MRSAVASAARATRFVHESASLSGISKDDRSPVTIADWASQAVVALQIGSAIPLVGEEDAAALRAPENAPLRARPSGRLPRARTRHQ